MRSVSHLPVLPPTLFPPNSPNHITSTLYHPPSSSVWASKIPMLFLPSSSLFPIPTYQGKEETLGCFCHKRLVYGPFIVLSPKQSLFLRRVGQRPSGSLSPGRRVTTLVWSSETPEVKKTPFSFYPATAMEKTPVSQWFIFPICEASIHSVTSEKGPDSKYKSYCCNFFLVFNHKEHCSALSLFISSALIFITGENPHDWKPLLETTAGRNHNMTYEKTRICAKPVGRDEMVFPCSGNILSRRR